MGPMHMLSCAGAAAAPMDPAAAVGAGASAKATACSEHSKPAVVAATPAGMGLEARGQAQQHAGARVSGRPDAQRI